MKSLPCLLQTNDILWSFQVLTTNTDTMFHELINIVKKQFGFLFHKKDLQENTQLFKVMHLCENPYTRFPLLRP